MIALGEILFVRLSGQRGSKWPNLNFSKVYEKLMDGTSLIFLLGVTVA